MRIGGPSRASNLFLYWADPDKVTKRSSFGDNITHIDWCKREAERVNAQGGRIATVVFSKATGRVGVVCESARVRKVRDEQ